MTTDPQTLAWLDQEDAHLAQVIRAHRWSVQFVGAGDDYVSARMPVDERTRQPAGVLHGGASVTLA